MDKIGENEFLYWDVQETYRETIQEQITIGYRMKKKTIIVLTKSVYLIYDPPPLPPFPPGVPVLYMLRT